MIFTRQFLFFNPLVGYLYSEFMCFVKRRFEELLDDNFLFFAFQIHYFLQTHWCTLKKNYVKIMNLANRDSKRRENSVNKIRKRCLKPERKSR